MSGLAKNVTMTDAERTTRCVQVCEGVELKIMGRGELKRIMDFSREQAVRAKKAEDALDEILSLVETNEKSYLSDAIDIARTALRK